MDPESGLDAVRNLGIRDGRIEEISANPLVGERIVDATGLVVTPGFIDLHAHGQSEEVFRLMVRDGVTTAFELEVGTVDVSAWYGEREGGQILNYGVSIGHIPVRMRVMGDSGDFLPSGRGGTEPATEDSMAEMERQACPAGKIKRTQNRCLAQVFQAARYRRVNDFPMPSMLLFRHADLLPAGQV